MPEIIPVVWHEGSSEADNRSRYAIATLWNNTLDTVGGFSHHGTLPAGAQTAIFVVHAEHEARLFNQILAEVRELKSSIIVFIGDEGSYFPYQNFIAHSRKLWIQYPIPGMFSFASNFLGCSAPHNAVEILNRCNKTKTIDWFFSGQVNHPRRISCVGNLKRISGGVLHQTPGFWQGIPHEEYYKLMASAKVIPCPAGPLTPDSIRVFEALEAGCVPIVDGRAPRNNYPAGYWNTVFCGLPAPFPVIDDWDRLPEVMSNTLRSFPTLQLQCAEWYGKYKDKLVKTLEFDIATLGMRR